MAKLYVKVYRWDLAKIRARESLDLISHKAIDAPSDHDAAREAAQAHALVEAGGGRVCGCSALASGGFSVTVRSPGS